IDFLRPDLDKEEIETFMREINKDSLIRTTRPAIPPNPGRDVVDRQGNPHDDPFQATEIAPRLFRLDLLASRKKGSIFLLVDRTDINIFNGAVRHALYSKMDRLVTTPRPRESAHRAPVDGWSHHPDGQPRPASHWHGRAQWFSRQHLCPCHKTRWHRSDPGRQAPGCPWRSRHDMMRNFRQKPASRVQLPLYPCGPPRERGHIRSRH